MLVTAYRLLEALVSSRPWVGRHGFSMADCAGAPALFYASTIEPIPADLPQVSAYLRRLTDRPSFGRVLKEAKPFFAYYPFADQIPARFRQG